MPRHPQPVRKELQTAFTRELERQLLESKRNMAEVAELVGCPRSQISRYRRGANRTVSADTLQKLMFALSASPHDQARLVAAHMESHGYDLHGDLIQVKVIGDTRKSGSRPRTEEERTLDFLAERSKKDPKVRDLLRALAAALGHGQAA